MTTQHKPLIKEELYHRTNTNDIILAQNKLLTQKIDELPKNILKLPQEMKEMHKVPQ